MPQPPDKPENDKLQKGTWTDGGPVPGGPQDKSFAYRQSRRAFIAACQRAGADVIGRVHPARGPDGLPLFLDAAAFGPRLAKSGVLVVAYGAPGAGVLQAGLASPAASRPSVSAARPRVAAMCQGKPKQLTTAKASSASRQCHAPMRSGQVRHCVASLAGSTQRRPLRRLTASSTASASPPHTRPYSVNSCRYSLCTW